MTYVNDDGSITSNAAPRYRLVGYDIGTAPDANGGWVHWTDYARLEAEIAHLRADLANAGAVMVEACARELDAAAGERREQAQNLRDNPSGRKEWDRLLLERLRVAAQAYDIVASRIRALSTLSPIAAAARVLLAQTEAANDPEIGPWLRALAEQEKADG